METDIVEGNNAIRLFIGDDFVMKKLIESGKWNEARDLLYNEDLEFHSDWNWLMPVVEKIEALGEYQVEIDLCSCYIIATKTILDGSEYFVESHEDSKIKAVWLAVIEFIKWLNKSK